MRIVEQRREDHGDIVAERARQVGVEIGAGERARRLGALGGAGPLRPNEKSAHDAGRGWRPRRAGGRDGVLTGIHFTLEIAPLW
jgi:hypothetical protein